MAGNIIHLTALTGTGATVGWYEIVSVTNGNNLVLDRTPTNGVNNITAGTYYIGGALDLAGSLGAGFFTQFAGGNHMWLRGGAYTLGSAINGASTSCTDALPGYIYGYSATGLRGDTCSPFGLTPDSPVISSTSNNFNLNNSRVHCGYFKIQVTGNALGFNPGVGSVCHDVKVLHSHTGNQGIAFTSGNSSLCYNIEAVSGQGTAVTCGSSSKLMGIYAHDSATLLSTSANPRINIDSCVLAGHVSASGSKGVAFGNTSDTTVFNNVTVYGHAGSIGPDTGILVTETSVQGRITNCIIYGFNEAINQTGAYNKSNVMDTCILYSNGTQQGSNWVNNPNTQFVDPQFVNVTELSGTIASISNGTVTHAGKFGTVVPGTDIIVLHSGSNLIPGGYFISNSTNDVVVTATATGALANPLSSATSAADKVWTIRKGNDFRVGANARSSAFPGLYPGNLFTSFNSVGGVQSGTIGGTLGGGQRSLTF